MRERSARDVQASNDRQPADERVALLAVARAPGVGPSREAALLRAFGSARAAVEAGQRGDWPPLPRWSATRSRAAGRAVDLAAAERELQRGARIGARLVACGDVDYPASWQLGAGWPLALWVRGAWPAEVVAETPLAVAVVGPRRASPAAQRFAAELAAATCHAGAWVVSGLAYGVDAAAHQGALDAVAEGAPASTVAVLAGGVDRPHPAAHRDLARALLAGGGGLVAAAPIGAVPATGAFPVRNRWIAGLSSVVAVVEAGPRSGALHTVAAALELGREVRTTPARPWDAHAAGSLALLRDGAAPLIEADDGWRGLPVGTLRPATGGHPRSPPSPPPPWDRLLRGDARPVDALAEAAAMSLSAALGALELGVLAGWAVRLSNGRYGPAPPARSTRAGMPRVP